MRILVSGATTTVQRLSPHPNLGQLLTPDNGNDPKGMVAPWAADNAAFVGFNEARFLRMLDRIQPYVPAARQEGTGPMWVVAPDVVFNAQATLDLFDVWQPRLAARGFPVALVAQNGIERLTVPWDRLDCLFLGATTPWKLSDVFRALTHEAKARGKLVHMGRVNSHRRLRIAYAWGCDSVDGTGYSMFPDTHLPAALNYLKRLHRTPPTFYHQGTFFAPASLTQIPVTV